MKQKLLVILLFISAFTSAQIVNIPDVNFKSRLLRSSATSHSAKDINGNYFAIDANADGEIQETEALAVYWLNINTGSISNLQGISSFLNLTYLSCYGNNLTTLNVSGLSNLVTLNVYDNSLTSLVLNGCSSLTNLNCYENNLTTIDLTGLGRLRYLACRNNRLTAIDLTPVNLIGFNGSDNLFTTMDFSTQTNLVGFSLYDNINLTTVNLKNGRVQYFNSEEFGGCTNLTSICLDADEYDVVYNSIIIINSWYPNWNIENIEFSTTCGETGDHDNMITGIARFDFDGNGCDYADPIRPFVKVNSVHEGNTSSIWTTDTGYYSFIAQTGNYAISPELTDAPYFTTSESPVITFNELDGTIVTRDFCITADGIHPDLEVTASANNGITAGSNQRYYLTYKNKGNQILSGNIMLEYNGDALTLTNVSPNYTTNVPGLLTCNFTNLQPFETRTIAVTLRVNTPTSPFPVNIGDVLSFSVTGNNNQQDETPENNRVDFYQTVRYSQDPNNIVCLEGETVSVDKIGEYLHYTINFENIGTAAAGFVVITNELDDTKYNLQSLQILNSSNTMVATLTGNVLTFRFANIYLAPFALGYVTYKIKTLETLTANDVVTNQASIVFDENEPLITNEAITAFAVLGRDDFGADTLNIYPNPTTGLLKIQSKLTVNKTELYDVQGRLLQTNVVNGTDGVVDISSKPKGIYLLKVISDRGTVTKKVIKN
ncbi:T9SS type A sorting domain-containing protein [Flavobacterium sp. Sd200]|uniref:T9SS type A sorting domain-containing protein n=1 Tax=Flavobacterium sp. Sd200 TaxID=2692211 RepID=UPI0013709A29|nr:T9SS type A sorting domain-containing protein [Flavobacterium sp. Sd200]MXN91613.1 T9SS type A sorting domain-containing protein [Flavobacterium sp. Sd200]